MSSEVPESAEVWRGAWHGVEAGSAAPCAPGQVVPPELARMELRPPPPPGGPFWLDVYGDGAVAGGLSAGRRGR